MDQEHSFPESIFRQVHEAWLATKESSPVLEGGYSVFYSPVPKATPLLIIGYNPGGGAGDFNPDLAKKIPTDHDYLTHDYALAKAMRSLFDKMGRSELLGNSVKTNLIYFRSKNISEWKKVPQPVRTHLEDLCAKANMETIKVLQPKVILAEGFETYRALLALLAQETKATEPSDVIVRFKELSPKQIIIGIKHPTGARLSTKQREDTAYMLNKLLKNKFGDSVSSKDGI